ncbi:nitrate/nitrite transporter NrtS [Leptolyngbya sp. AN03gr2]|jgi:hypothetical protein|uniref:nitrate/nitrite transporter NrtS n=1 Tax=unclassified Leptolyngbya TaxID=2650499 RepID=UPI003D322E6C
MINQRAKLNLSRKPQRVSANALKFAVIIGSVLFTINHGSALVKGEMHLQRWFSAALGYVAPLVTSVYCPCAQRDRHPQKPLTGKWKH